MLVAIFGLMVVVIGSHLSVLKDWILNRASKTKDQIYLAIQVG